MWACSSPRSAAGGPFGSSSDSGSPVIDQLASGGRAVTPVWQRVFWAVMEGAVAAVLLVAGGLAALQTMAVTSALPFAVIMLVAALGLWRALIIESHHDTSLQNHVQRRQRYGTLLWKKRLYELFDFPARKDVMAFIRGPVIQALEHVQKALHQRGWPAEVVFDEEHGRAYLTVHRDGVMDFIYDVRLTERPRPAFAYPEMDRTPGPDEVYYRPEVYLRRGGQSYSVYEYNEQEIIDDVLDHFESYLQFLDTAPATLPWATEEHDEMIDAPEGGGSR
ncbi:BCCT family transporter [Halorhodospira sp. 9622]|uniref:BCCT family transporter n=1 Tax=Halorhodospira sp. 9622 TaxID=2899136 RepID=UPI001EE90261|nr:BCCT family transporter [Halorhodospira sp. 9622]MCG5538046.1 BCCT family transporter [Halorhodospira sp. 9622]